ncbi:type IV pilus twitching motility protein PilT [Persephonella sp.]
MVINQLLTDLTERFGQASDFIVNPEGLYVVSSKQIIHKEKGDFSQAVEDVIYQVSDVSGDKDTSWKVSDDLRFRLNIAKYDGNKYELTFRWLRPVQWKLEDYNLNERVVSNIFDRVRNRKGGLFLVIGPTGSGKSTVMAAILNALLEKLPIRVVSIEDPVEYRLNEGIGSVIQREVGADTESFNRALKSALRQNPNVIFVGEVRDRETVKLLLEASDTGHVVFATMHTDTPKDTVERLMGMVSVDEHDFIISMLQKVLVGVLGLRMYDYNRSKLMLYEYLNGEDPAIKSLIGQKAFSNFQTYTGNVDKGHIPFAYSFAEVVAAGKARLEDADQFGIEKNKAGMYLSRIKRGG